MKQKKCIIVLVCVLLFTLNGLSAQSKFSFDRYHTPDELVKALTHFVSSNPKITNLHKIAVSPGGKAVNFIEIGSEVNKKKKNLPAVFVVANMEGTVPLSSEAAIHLIQSILKKPEVRKDKTWYVLPLGNPDAAAKYFSKPTKESARLTFLEHLRHNNVGSNGIPLFEKNSHFSLFT